MSHRSRILVVAVLATLVAALVLTVDAVRRPATASEPQVVTLDGNDQGRTFDGVGGVSAGGSSRLLLDYPEPERSQILDYLFRPRYGASLDILKVEIGGDIDATEGAEPSHMRTPDSVDCHRGYEWWLMREAKARNPHIRFYGLAWGAPGWFGGGYWSPDRVTYLLNWLGCAKANGFHIDYLGGGNESGFDRDVYVKLAAALDAHGYSDVKVVASDEHNPPNYWRVAQQMPGDKAFADAVDVLGEHDVCEWRTEQRRCHGDDTALGLGKPLWDSENSTQEYDVGAAPLARAMNRHYIDARITGNLNWALLDAWYDDFPIGGTGLLEAQQPWSGAYEIGPEIWVDAQTTQFTRPGWRYLDGASGYSAHGASYVSLRAPRSGDWSTVIETVDETAPETFRLDVTGGLDAQQAAHVWSTDVATKSTADDFVDLGVVHPTEDGSLTLHVRPGHVYTVSTTTGQHKGTARSQADPGTQLAVPYREGFEQVRQGDIARYFSDVHGGFAAEPCAGGRRGMCYEQTVPTQPLPWHGVVMPATTMVGDPRWWGDYEAGADVLLNGADDVELLGRVDSQQHNAAGYHLLLASDGTWSLFSEDPQNAKHTLASGSTAAPGKDTWHHLALRFRGDQITALLDGSELASVRDDAHTSGQVGLRVGGWAPAQFDDVSVVPTAPWPHLLAHQGMTVTATSDHAANAFGHSYPASHAIDDRLWSTWRSEYTPTQPLPQALTLDLGGARDVAGITYTPSVAQATGQITRYRVETSADGRSYATAAEGYWEPTEAVKTASWAKAVRARYVRLVALAVHGCPSSATVAELNVSTTPLPSLGTGTPPSEPPPDYPHLVPTADMSATATSEQSGYEAGKAIDGNCATMWHTSWSPYQPPPQSITLDLGSAYPTSALVYQPRQDSSRNGVIGHYDIAVSTDGTTFTKVASGDWPAGDAVKHADWSPATARYVRLTGTGANGYVSAAELAVAYSP